MEWMYDNSYDSFSLEIGDYIVTRGILLADIVEATFMVKESREDQDADAKVTLVVGSGLVKVSGDTEADAVLKGKFSPSDFGVGALVVGPKYYMGLGIKVAGEDKYLEMNPVDRNLRIVSDFIHD